MSLSAVFARIDKAIASAARCYRVRRGSKRALCSRQKTSLCSLLLASVLPLARTAGAPIPPKRAAGKCTRRLPGAVLGFRLVHEFEAIAGLPTARLPVVLRSNLGIGAQPGDHSNVKVAIRAVGQPIDTHKAARCTWQGDAGDYSCPRW